MASKKNAAAEQQIGGTIIIWLDFELSPFFPNIIDYYLLIIKPRLLLNGDAWWCCAIPLSAAAVFFTTKTDQHNGEKGEI